MFENPRIEESPQRQPGYCRGCRATSLVRDWIMDLDIDDEDHPGYAIQLCNVCFNTLAVLAGYQKFEMLERMNADRMEELERENDELRNVDRVLSLLGLDSNRLIRVGILSGLSFDAEQDSTGHLASPDEQGSTGTDREVQSRAKRTNRLRVKGAGGTTESSDDEDVGTVRPGSSSDTI